MKMLPTKEQTYYLGVKAIIRNVSGEVLVLKRSGAGYWDLPGGRVHVNESPTKTLMREVYEETGIQNLFHMQANALTVTPLTLSAPSGEKIGLILWYYTCCVIGTSIDVHLSDEHCEFAWLAWEQVQERVSFFGADITFEPTALCGYAHNVNNVSLEGNS